MIKDVTPKYVIHSEHLTIVREFKNPFDKIIRYGAIGIVLIVLLFYFLLRINLYEELSSLPKLMFGLIIMYSIFLSKEKKEIRTPFEIRLYDDHLVLYHENRVFSSKKRAKFISHIMYEELRAVKYEKETQILYIYGDMDMKYYYYKPDGSLPTKPTRQKNIADTLIIFWLCNNDADQIIKDLKEYGNITVLDKKTDDALYPENNSEDLTKPDKH